MARKADLGEFEHLVLLAALRLGDSGYAPEIAGVLEERAGREMSRGTLYAALDRLESRGLLKWEPAEAIEGRSGGRRRLFEVTAAGRAALAARRRVLIDMWEGVEDLILGGTP